MITKKKLEHILNNYTNYTKEELYALMLELINSKHQAEYETIEKEYVKRLK